MEYVLVWLSFFCFIWECGGLCCGFGVLLSDIESVSSDLESELEEEEEEDWNLVRICWVGFEID